MPILFILGRPGSGKSKVARWIARQEPLVSDCEVKKWLLKGWEASHITDYRYLLQMFQEERNCSAPLERRFVASKYGGFKVTEPAVLDEALSQANAEILVQMNDPYKLVLVEFARKEYRTIWKLFDPVILGSAYFLYLQADLDLCVERVHRRALRKRYEDDTFVPEDVIRSYYRVERFADLQETFGVERVRIINNSGLWSNTWEKVEEFLDEVASGTPVPAISSRSEWSNTLKRVEDFLTGITSRTLVPASLKTTNLKMSRILFDIPPLSL